MKIRQFVVMLVTLGLLLLVPGFTQSVETSVATDEGAAPALSAFTAVAAGYLHTCAVTVDGRVKCWGWNSYGQLGGGTDAYSSSTPVDVSGLESGITALAAGASRTCALTSGGGVKCWGDGISNTPVAISRLESGVTALAVGEGHACALIADGSVMCWGANRHGQLGDGTAVDSPKPVPVIELADDVAALATGGLHTCAVTTGGRVQCWGGNGFGQLGVGTTTGYPKPVDVIGLASNVTALAAGSEHTCALTANGGVKCWGANWNGQLGDGTTTGSYTPVDVSGLGSGVTALAAYGDHTCALIDDGGVKCWGANRSTPVAVAGLASDVTALAMGGAHTCAVTASSRVQCWGDNRLGQLGDGTYTHRSTPVAVSGLASGATALAAGGYYHGRYRGHTCVVTAAGGVKCWGANQAGQLGDGTTTNRSTPVAVSGLTNDTMALAAGNGHTCALTTDGGVKCWGANWFGQLGDGTTTNRSMPVDVDGMASGVTVLAAGTVHTCAVTAAGGVKCWGDNQTGQLGDGTTTDRSTPVNVEGLGNGVTALAAGEYHTCAVTAAGGVKCWGANWLGQLGDGTLTDSRTPVDVSGLASGVTALVAGERHTCAVTAAGGVKCWGHNGAGQLGDGTYIHRNTPVEVVGLGSGVTALAAGGSNGEGHTCAVTAAGGVKCWGYNEYGRLGGGTTVDSNTPVGVIGLASGVTALAAGDHHTCALVTGGWVKCWGFDGYGQLGIGTDRQRTTPVGVVTGGRLSVNYATGQPGSYFTLTGEYFLPSSVLTITVNHAVSTTLQANEMGDFILFLDTAVADEGGYLVTADANPKASVFFPLDEAAPLRPQEGGGQTLVIPAGMAGQYRSVYLPAIQCWPGGG